MRDRTDESPPTLETVIRVVGEEPAEPVLTDERGSALKRFIERMRKSCYLDEQNHRLDAFGRLRAQYLNDGLALFLGAGVSAGSNVRGWQPLAENLLDRLGLVDAKTAQGLSLYAKFDLAFYECEGKNLRFLDHLYESLYGPVSPQLRADLKAIKSSDTAKQAAAEIPLWQRIAGALEDNQTLKAVGNLLLRGVILADELQRLNPQIHAVLTTNADNLLELYLLARCHGRRRYTTVDRPSVGDHPGVLSIYHLHGVLDARGEGFLQQPPAECGPALVFRESEYFETIANPMDFANYTAQSFFQRYNVLFIGTSLDDMNIRRWLYNSFTERRIARERYLVDLYKVPYPAAGREASYQSIRHFWLRQKEGSAALQRDIQLVMRNLGVQIVWYDVRGGDHSQAAKKIDAL